MTYQLSGTVSSAAGGGVSGATLTVTDGPNVGRSATTTSSGAYQLTLPTGGGFTLRVSAAGFVEANKGFDLGASSPSQSANFTLLPSQAWTRRGSGDTVFDIPTYITRVRIVGDYTGYSTNFVVYIGGRLVVNELLGRGWGTTHFEGTYLTSGGVTEIKLSSGVNWSFSEVR